MKTYRLILYNKKRDVLVRYIMGDESFGIDFTKPDGSPREVKITGLRFGPLPKDKS